MRVFTKTVPRNPRNMCGCDIGHRLQNRKSPKMIERDCINRVGFSREAAEECSPRREPWVERPNKIHKPRRGGRNMSHTSGNILLHMIFSTHGRRPLIKSDFRADLFAYLGGIIRETGGTALIVKGTEVDASARRERRSTGSRHAWVHGTRRFKYARVHAHGFTARAMSAAGSPSSVRRTSSTRSTP